MNVWATRTLVAYMVTDRAHHVCTTTAYRPSSVSGRDHHVSMDADPRVLGAARTAGRGDILDLDPVAEPRDARSAARSRGDPTLYRRRVQRREQRLLARERVRFLRFGFLSETAAALPYGAVSARSPARISSVFRAASSPRRDPKTDPSANQRIPGPPFEGVESHFTRWVSRALTRTSVLQSANPSVRPRTVWAPVEARNLRASE